MKGALSAAAAVAAALSVAGFISLHTDTPTTAPVIQPERVIVDMDHAIDDVFALALALRSPELQVVGITIAPHPEAELQARFVARLLRELGLEGIPVAIGSSLLTHSCRCGHWQPISHQLGVDWPAPISESAAEFIARQANATPGEVSILTFGPLTNLGEALRQNPGIAEKISRLVMMGTAGLRSEGRCYEYNVSTDLEAARLVFESGIPVLAVGVDVTGRLSLSREEIEAALSGQDHFSQVLRMYWQASGATGFCPHDLLATAAAVDESLFAWAQGDGSIAGTGCLSFAPSAGGRLGVATAANGERLLNFTGERLRSSQTAQRARATAPAQTSDSAPPRVPEKVIFDLQWFADDVLALGVQPARRTSGGPR